MSYMLQIDYSMKTCLITNCSVWDCEIVLPLYTISVFFLNTYLKVMSGFVICQFGCMCEPSHSLMFNLNSELFLGNTIDRYNVPFRTSSPV